MSTPASSAGGGALKYLNLAISEMGLSEFSQGKRVVFIPKDEVQKIEVRYGSSAERPLVQIIAGLLLIGLGGAGLLMIFESGMRGIRWGIGFVAFGGFGVWLLYETFKKTHYLQVTYRRETRKLVLKGAFQEREFSELARQAGQLGYRFEDSPEPGSAGPVRGSI